MNEARELGVTGAVRKIPAKRHRQPGVTPQVHLLTRLIEVDPGAPVHYLLRGEEWLVCGQLERARADFEQAWAQAEKQRDASDWGYLYQSYIDRAETGLRQCR